MAVRMAIRLIYLVIGSSLMTLTTTPNQLTDGLEKSLRPLNKIHVPVHEIAMMMSIALRFIPILLEETDKIMKAQIARGADFENGNLDPEGQKHGSASCPAVYLSIPPCQRSGNGDGSEMLPWRRSSYTDEATSLCKEGPRRISGICS